MRTSATDSGVADGWRGARIGAEGRDRARRELLRVPAEVDIGEPRRPAVTLAFLAVALAVTFWEFVTFGASPGTSELSRAGGAGVGAVATGAWWKLLTANLLHANLAHVAMNAFVIVLTGRWLEHLVGRLVVAATIAWSMLLASFGALLVDAPVVGIGASGVAFGLVGCALAADPRGRTATGVIARQLALVNVIGTFLIPGISIGGHFGGLAAGLLVGWVAFDRTASTTPPPVGRPRRVRAGVVLAASLPIAALLVIGPGALPDDSRELRANVVAPLLSRQLSGATLSSGRELDDAECDPAAADDPLEYRCRIDGDVGTVRYSRRDDQWSISLPQ